MCDTIADVSEPTPAASRQLWLDVARGLAVVSMVVAHTAPVGGIFNISEYLTMPWFAMLMGCGFWFAWHQRPQSAVGFGLAGTVRGLLLVGFGLLIEPIHPQVVVVLETLGVASIAVAWLTPVLAVRPLLTTVVAGVVIALSAVVIPWATGSLAGLSGAAEWWVRTLAAGPYYRAITMAFWMLLGLGVADLLQRRRASRGHITFAAIVTLLATGSIHLSMKRSFGDEFLPYSGTPYETLHNAVLAMAATLCVVVALAWVPAVARWLEPLAALGRLALTGYVMQLVILAALTTWFLDGGRDDHWWVLLTTVALLVGGAWVWERLGWPRPLETLLRLPNRLLWREPSAREGGQGG